MNVQTKLTTTIFLLIIILSLNTFAQSGISINDNGNPPDNTAILDISSTSQGILIPRMTTAERNTIVSPAASLLIYNTTEKCYQFYENSVWQCIGTGGGGGCIDSATAGVYIIPDIQGAICNGGTIVFTAIPINGGSTPTYQWKVNSVDVPGEIDSTFSTSTLSDGDEVTCEVTSNGTCIKGSPVLSNTITMTVNYIVKTYQGGTIFYLYPGCQAGLISSTANQGNHQWGCSSTFIGTSAMIGTGTTNTVDIVAGCGDADFCAKTCSNLSLNGYSDWFQPSKNELNEMYIQRAVIPMGTDYYSSSTEVSSTQGWGQDFATGTQDPSMNKNTTFPKLRCIREF